MNTLWIVGIFLSMVVLMKIEAGLIRSEEKEAAKLKRQFETTCAFYRWSHCPGKKEVDNVSKDQTICHFVNFLLTAIHTDQSIFQRKTFCKLKFKCFDLQEKKHEFKIIFNYTSSPLLN